jgi:hypothetical protein
MQDGRSGGRKALQDIKDIPCCSPAMNRENSASYSRTCVEDFRKDIQLILPKWFGFPGAVKPNFANVVCLLNQPLKKRKLVLPFMSKLRMHA